MVSVAGPQPKAYHYRAAENFRELIRIAHPQHDIRLLVGGDSGGNHVEVPQVLFGLLQLHYNDVGIRCGSDIAYAIVQPAARRHPRHSAAMSFLVPAGHDGIGIL